MGEESCRRRERVVVGGWGGEKEGVGGEADDHGSCVCTRNCFHR